MLAFFAAFLGVALVATILAPKFVRWRVDQCLDRGGRYLRAEGRCDVRGVTERPQPGGGAPSEAERSTPLASEQ